MKVPRGRAGAKTPFSLNEVRRFGYRIDTVAKWVAPPAKDRLLLEGLKLAEMENLLGSIAAVVGTGADYVAKWGADRFVSKEDARQYPAFAALSQAIESFVKENAAGTSPEAKSQAATAFFGKIKTLVADDTRGLAENQFSGYYSLQLKDSLDRYKEFNDWYDGTAMAPFREAWLASRATTGNRNATTSSIDPAKFKLTLADRVGANEPPDSCHHVSYSAQSEPPNLDGLFWVITHPGGEQHAYQMHKTGIRLHMAASGTYQVYVEFRGGDKPAIVSNIVEIPYTAAAAAPPGAKPAPAVPPGE